MFSLEDILGQQQGSQAVDQISQQVGAEPSLVNSAIQMALPAILGGLAKNVSNPAGAESLNNAVDQHTGGGILDSLGGLGGLGSLASSIFGGGQPTPQTDAGGILGHILGNSQGQVAQQVSQNTGLGVGQVAQILMMLAPIVMSYLGKQKQEQGLDAGGLASMVLGHQQQAQSSGNPVMNIVSSMLDSDHDGSSVDDIASMAFKYMTSK